MTSKDLDNPFVEWLAAQMESRRWTIQILAEEAGIAQATLWNIMNRKRAVGPEVLRALAKVLGLSQVEIFHKAGMIDEDWLQDGDIVLVQIRNNLSRIEDDEDREQAIRLMGAIVNEVATRKKTPKTSKAKNPGKGDLATGKT